MKQFIIPGNTPSSKNSKVKTRWGGVIKNKNTLKWEAENEELFKTIRDEFRSCTAGLSKPFPIYFSFRRQSRHKADFGNICQAVLDQMTKFDLIDDDNWDEILPYPYLNEDGKCHVHDKENPCTIITIL